jgi:hypothetical protein
MEAISGAILSSFLYDMLKHRVSLSAKHIKENLQGWLIDDSVARSIERELSKLQLTDEMSEVAIARKLAISDELTALLKSVQPSIQNTQIHTGAGDNVAGNKITNN